VKENFEKKRPILVQMRQYPNAYIARWTRTPRKLAENVALERIIQGDVGSAFQTDTNRIGDNANK